ncbi:hypothetical protein [Rhodococcus opacus]|uniref:hypothetical protein n=1 Tax=Rhodococcus TaxID=1827 RepID=UPI000A895C68|nr:hypothetical protein [Rhodococcus opacus]MDX5962929.1 hypothetical protein [Rhodococcus opacus]NHU45683.1 hypothetical protein [Rhodococcus sp. A14]NKY69856.1 hypothetical protein [Rhodococcus opacus]CAG7599454.1 hypothetical protein E143388_04759 [Rhodococcus opacus]
MFDQLYVLYPRGARTGGPEALHQLVHTLREQGQDAYLVPLPGTEDSPRVPQYHCYEAPERTQITDNESNAIISPEVSVEHLRRYPRSKKFCWWLSIDNSRAFGPRLDLIAHRNGFGERAGLLALARRYGKVAITLRDRHRTLPSSVVHLAQSQYAHGFLHANCRIVASCLSDFTPDVEEIQKHRHPEDRRSNTVVYNPMKGGLLASKVASRLPEVDFLPASNMLPHEVYRLFGRSAVYLDLGPHPGKDRMPREAATAGAIVVAAARGSAANGVDVPIPTEHKIVPSPQLVDDTVERLREVLGAQAKHSARQDEYRDMISRERDRFSREVAAIFVDGLRGFDAATEI